MRAEENVAENLENISEIEVGCAVTAALHLALAVLEVRHTPQNQQKLTA